METTFGLRSLGVMASMAVAAIVTPAAIGACDAPARPDVVDDAALGATDAGEVDAPRLADASIDAEPSCPPCEPGDVCHAGACVRDDLLPRWPVPSDTPFDGDFVVTPDTSLDTVTGLMWERRTTPQRFFTWNEAVAHCDALVLGGHDDWRLPSIVELLTIVNYSRYLPALSPALFPETEGLGFWSHTPLAGAPGGHWTVLFGYGETGQPFAVQHEVRCVRTEREPRAPAAARFVVGNEVTLDRATGLTWQRVPAQVSSRLEAVRHCVNLHLGGFTSGWRLPSVKQLVSIIDYRRSNPANDATAFTLPDVSPAPEVYWTDTDAVQSAQPSVWEVLILDGAIGRTPVTTESTVYYARCVRD